MIGIANKTIVPLNLMPTANSELADELLYGMKAEVVESAGSVYVKIKTHYGYIGYAKKNHFLMEPECIDLFDQVEKRVVMTGYADVMSAPKVQGKCLISLTRGAIVGYMGKIENGWCAVRLCDGKSGYMREQFLAALRLTYSVTEENTLRQSLLHTAEAYLGVQYRWGGKSSLGIDCSGLCSMAYMLNGILIYRDAEIKPEYPIREIPYSQVKIGDLMYFPGHVAMYAGNNNIIHSTSRFNGVVYNSLYPNGPYPYSDFLKSLKKCGTVFSEA